VANIDYLPVRLSLGFLGLHRCLRKHMYLGFLAPGQWTSIR
jgi:hypothetical protein